MSLLSIFTTIRKQLKTVEPKELWTRTSAIRHIATPNVHKVGNEKKTVVTIMNQIIDQN